MRPRYDRTAPGSNLARAFARAGALGSRAGGVSLRGTGRLGYATGAIADQIQVQGDAVVFGGRSLIGGAVQVGADSIALPNWPTLPAVSLNLPVNAQAYTRVLERVGAASPVAAAMLRGNAMDAIAGAAAFAPPPYGLALAVGLQVAGPFVSSLLASPPPPPNVAGVDVIDLQTNPIRDVNTAVLAGKIVSGAIEGGNAGPIISAARDILGPFAFGPLRDRASQATVDASLRAHGSSWRAAAFFLAYAGNAAALSSGSEIAPTVEERKQAGKLIGWAFPRVQIREMIWYWFLYRVALSGWAATGGNPNGSIVPSSGHTVPVAGVDFRPEWSTTTYGWGGTKRIAGAGAVDVSPAKWWQLVVDRAMPVPQEADDLTWAYTPIDGAVLASELAWYQTWPAPNWIVDVPLAGQDTWTARMPDSGEELSYFPENYSAAADLCFALAVSSTKPPDSQGRVVANTHAAEVAHVRSLMAEATSGAPISADLHARLLMFKNAQRLKLLGPVAPTPSRVVPVAVGASAAAAVAWGFWRWFTR